MKTSVRVDKRNIKEAKNNLMLLAIAFVCAIASWFIIAMTIYPSETKIVTDIPVSLDITGTSAAENGLRVLTPEEAHVTVKFDCSRTNYNKLNNETIKAYVDFDNITTPGARTLSVKIEGPDSAAMSKIKVSPANIKVELDVFESKSFAVKAKLPNIKTVEGKTMNIDEVTCDPPEVVITGPASRLAKIKECYAVSDKKALLDSSISLNSNRYILLSEDGTEIDQEESHITVDSSVMMNVSVLTQKTVNIVPHFTYVPDNFDTSCLDCTITPDTITIASTSAETNLPDELQVPIPVSTVDIGYSQNFDINNLLTTNKVKNISGIDMVNVTINSDGLDSKEITLTKDDINLLNKPNDNYNYSIMNEKLVVKIIGPKDKLENITAKDLSAIVDLLNADVSMEQFQYDVKISCNTRSDIWSVTNLKITVKKTLKEGVTTQAGASSVNTTTTN